MRWRWMLMCCAVGCLVWAEGAARAEGAEWDAEAARLAGEGSELFSEGRFAEAAERFEQAYDHDPDVNLLFNAAVCREKADQPLVALGHVEAFLRANPAPPGAEAGRAALERIEATLAKSMARVEFASAPEGAEVFLDGGVEPAGRTPLVRWLTPGEHAVAFRSEGFVAAERTLALVVNERREIAVDLAAAPPPDVPPPDAPPLDVPPAGEGGTVFVPAETTAPEGFQFPWTAWSTVGATAVGLGVGIAFQVLGQQQASDASDYADRPGADHDRWQGMVDDARRDLTVSGVGFGIAAAAAVGTGVILWLANTDDESGGGISSPAVSLQPALGGSGGLVQIRF